MTFLLVAVALQSLPTLESELWVNRLRPETKEGLAAQLRFKEAVARSKWEDAFVQAGVTIKSMGFEPYAHVQIDWKRYELMLLAGKVDFVISYAKQNMSPLGTYKAVMVRRPQDYDELHQKYYNVEDFKPLSDKYMAWGWSYFEAARYLEIASALKSDFKTAISAIDEMQSAPVFCGTGMAPIEFGFTMRRVIWRIAGENPSSLQGLADGHFVPLELQGVDAEYQIRYVSVFALFAQACLATPKESSKVYSKLARKIMERRPANQELFLVRLALDRSAKRNG